MPSRKTAMKVYVSDEEHQRIIDKAGLCGLSVSTFAKRVCLGYQIRSREDRQARRDLLTVNADLGRLGGLLKMWLTNEDEHEFDVRELLWRIEDRQREIKRVVARI
ncbi:plasmid mobilization protein [Pseudodesulfovibrio tunisiensis]|uniref:plasmid mobilization protein n=1 Tax=Pseudodesulfovibrio tunisiensis TaxID=463192 RepID=UPI001FB4BBA2|nr:conjugal transfer protein TraJ [Pseudodesulfovibrio tunisiensis]